jgi:tricorn protease-like protein
MKVVRYIGVVGLLMASAPAQSTWRVSVDSGGAQENGPSRDSMISANGQFVAFSSDASNLVPGDSNGNRDVFVHDLRNGQTIRVSVDSAGMQGNGDSLAAAVSADGRYVAFRSFASNLVPNDTNGAQDIFVHDCVTGTTSIIIANTSTSLYDYSIGPSISADGRYVAFASEASNLVTGDTNGSYDVFVFDRVTSETTLVSVDSNGVQGNGASNQPSISGDGRFVAFSSYASNLVPGDTNATSDVFVHDRRTGQTTRVSVDSDGVQGNAQSGTPSISTDGRFVAFGSAATNLVPHDTNSSPDIFLHDRRTGQTSIVSINASGAEGNNVSFNAWLSADGRFVTFSSLASNLVPGDTNAYDDIFVRDQATGLITRVSVSDFGTQGNYDSIFPSISADGRYTAFLSGATNLVPGDTSLYLEIFAHDRGAASSFTPYCPGDGTVALCPCLNTGLAMHGCENSASTGGAVLSATGAASLSADSAQLSASDELPTALSIVFQGSTFVAPMSFGDGLVCSGGTFERLAVSVAEGGIVILPMAGGHSLSSLSASVGDPIALGATRIYQVYYRDPDFAFCPGGSNVTNAIAIAWGA